MDQVRRQVSRLGSVRIYAVNFSPSNWVAMGSLQLSFCLAGKKRTPKLVINMIDLQLLDLA